MIKFWKNNNDSIPRVKVGPNIKKELGQVVEGQTKGKGSTNVEDHLDLMASLNGSGVPLRKKGGHTPVELTDEPHLVIGPAGAGRRPESG
jgi:hypothetical protein